MKHFLFCLLLANCIVASEFDQRLADRVGADKHGMKMYVLCILKTGPNDSKVSKKERDEIFAGHMKNIQVMADNGVLAAAGPFGKNDKNYRGLYVFNVKTVEEAEKLVQSDPAVKSQVLVAEMTPWYGSAALMMTNEIHKKISAPSVFTADIEQAAKNIIDSGLREPIKYLSSDALEGRGTGSRGDELAVKYIVEKLKSMGLKPGGADGAWTQRVPLVGVTSHTPAKTEFVAHNRKVAFKNVEDFVAFSGTQKPSTKLENAEVVFVGYGIVAPEFQWDDYKNVDVKGKVVMLMNYNPSVFAGKTRLWYGRWDYKYEQAAKKGAAGVIIIHTTPSAAYPWKVVQTSWQGEKFELEYEGEPRVEVRAWATEDACRKIAALSGADLDELRAKAESRDFKPVSLGVRWSIEFANTVRKAQSDNVIGMLEGSDAKLRGEGVFYSAHHDHLGKKGNAIYHGALDNASGVSSLLSIAKAFTALREKPKRSVYFVFTTAEEQGLLGSEYFTKHPPIAPGKMAANLNIDGISTSGKTKDVSMLGLGKSTIDAFVQAAVSESGRVLMGDQFPEHGGFYRSDQFPFAKIGVPAVFFNPGTDVIGKPKGYGKKMSDEYTEKDYHQPTDVYKESWDLSGAIEDARLQFAVGAAIANAAEMPTWTKGDEFEAIRLKALANTK